MKGKIATLLCVGFLPITVFAQAPDTLWTKTYGGMDHDYGRGIAQTTDGGYAVIGFTYSYGAGLDDVYLIKTDSLGDTVWTKTYGGSMYDAGSSVQQTFDGGFILVGSADMSGGGTSGKVYLIKTDSIGDTSWTKKFTRLGNDRGMVVKQTADSGYVISALCWNGMQQSFDIWLIKTNSDGDTLWTKTYGGMDMEDPFYSDLTSDGGVIITGATLSFGSGGADVYLVKTDSLGDTLWTRTYGGILDDWGTEVHETTDGGYVVVGATLSYGSGYQLFLIKTGSTGDTLWTKVYGGQNSETGQSLVQSSDSRFVIVGGTMSFGNGHKDIWLLCVNEYGDTLWTTTFGGTEYDAGCAIEQTSDDGYIIVGDTYSYGVGLMDIRLLKIEPDTLGVNEVNENRHTNINFGATILSGPLLLPEGKKCRVFDITGRIVVPDKMSPGIYFIEVEGKITQKVVKVR